MRDSGKESQVRERERESGTGVALFMNTRALCDELGPKDTRTPSADTKGTATHTDTDTDTKAQIQIQRTVFEKILRKY